MNDNIKQVFRKFEDMQIVFKIIFLLTGIVFVSLGELLLPLVIIGFAILIILYTIKGLVYNPIKYTIKKMKNLIWEK